ncbi:hypoxanthine phosphoribosyltransferase [Candidatus Woesearchaeota archaeon]|nr:hypoxanthine phosphoribosyltransferase [Candidatus Woesearchaeota archaeon]
MTEKYFISANELLIDSYKLARKIIDSNFKPNFIVALWRGGTPVGSALQEFLKYHNVQTDHIAIRTSSYEGIDRQNKEIKVHGLEYIEKHANSDDKLLIVDDVYDTGLSINAVLQSLKTTMRANMPKDIRIATVYYKPTRNKTNHIPEFYIHETDKWLVFPHELEGLTHDEIALKGSEIKELLK